MTMIPIVNTFSIIAKGYHIFRIYDVEYDPEFGKLIVHLVNAQGQTHKERFGLMNQDGSMNEPACGAFSYFAKTALNKFDIEEIDHTALINHYIKAEVLHTEVPSTKDPNKTVTFINLGDKQVADCFDTEPCKRALELGNVAPASPTPTPEPTTPADASATTKPGSLDLDSLLK